MGLYSIVGKALLMDRKMQKLREFRKNNRLPLVFTDDLGDFLISAEDFFFLFCIEDSALDGKEFELYLFFYARVLTELVVLEFIVFQGKYLQLKNQFIFKTLKQLCVHMFAC